MTKNSVPDPNQKKTQRLLVAGGGTGGHIWAGIAVAQEWESLHKNEAQVLFVGAKGRLEERLVPSRGYSLVTLRVGALKRIGALSRLFNLALIPVSVFKAILVLIKYRPVAVLGVGGYSSGPVILAAWCMNLFLKMKIGIVEQNAIPGLTNKLCGIFSDFAFVCYSGMDSMFKNSKVVLTGNPIRSEMTRLELPKNSKKKIFIFGGSQGAVGLNTLFLECVPRLKHGTSEFEVLHQTGAVDLSRVTSRYSELGVDWKTTEFIMDMKEAYRHSDLIICRAGASTIAELAAVARPAILVPLPTAADDHQKKNAEVLQSAGSAVIVEQGDGGSQKMAEIVDRFLSDSEELSNMANRVAQFYRPHAARDVVKHMSADES